MEMKSLIGFSLLLISIGILLAVGILMMGKFSDAARVSTVVQNESFVMPLKNAAVTLGNTDITTFTKVLNETGDVLPAANYTITKATGVLNNTGNITGFATGMTLYAYYTYDEYDTPAATSVGAVSDELSGIATNWLGLIIIVMIAAIVLGLVMRSFAGGVRR
jgi:hypothetical protein